MADLRIPNLQDTVTPFGVQLSGIYKQSFAYTTIKDRLPVILTRIVDTLCQNKNQIIDTYGRGATEDIKYIIGFISQLKNEIGTNKALKPMRLNPKAIPNDAEEWNKYLEYRTRVEGETPTWFNTLWLYCETYMYRVLAQEIGLTSSMQNYDPFEQHKQAVFINSIDSVDAVALYVKNIVCDENYNKENAKSDFVKLLKLSLWSNRYDLSLSAGSALKQTGNPVDIVESFDKDILVNDWESVWHIVKEKLEEDGDNIYIVFDNAGYELFADLCLAAFLVTIVPTTKITFYVKAYPWYVSDTTINDFHWILDYMSSRDGYPNLQLLSKTFKEFLDRKIWVVKNEPYWTGPYDIRQMKEKEIKTYIQLSTAKLVIFKGDLNYRKLLADINFEYSTSFITALGDFQPTNILSLRTLKSDVCVGLPRGLAEKLFEKDKNWLLTGEYGIIQAAVGLHKSHLS